MSAAAQPSGKISRDQHIIVELNSEGVRIKTYGWAHEQDFVTSRDEAWDWLCNVCNNGNAPPVRVLVWDVDQ
jgi:hypothetical protein